MKRGLAAATFLLCLVVLAPSLVVYFDGGFDRKERFRLQSLDGRYRVSIDSRVAFPATEIFDPSIKVWVQVSHISTDAVIDEAVIELYEQSNLGEPAVDWSGSPRIVVRNVDRTRPRDIELFLKPRTGAHPLGI